MPDELWHTHSDAAFSRQLDALIEAFPHVESAWRAVRWRLQHDPYRGIEADPGIWATTTLPLLGIPPLVWFYIIDPETKEIELVGVEKTVPDEE